LRSGVYHNVFFLSTTAYMITYFRSENSRYLTDKSLTEDVCNRSFGTHSQLTASNIRTQVLVVEETQDARNDALSSRTGRNEKKNNKPKVVPKHPKQIKRCTMSLYGNRPSYGIQTLHTDLWE
jgi:hypothetical protein